jgi:Family of unknown function (DUF5343)
MASLPYITAPGNIEKALRGIKTAATPERVSQDFVKTILQIPGGSGNQVTAFLKKIGLANADNTPSETYKQFRNPVNGGIAIAGALKVGYAPLYKRNEFMHQLSDAKLRGLIIEETGQGEDSNVVNLVLACINAMKKFANWEQQPIENPEQSAAVVIPRVETNGSDSPPISSPQKLGLNLSYTINLNLPATSDIAVFNAIFKSLKENLLRGSND